MFSLLKPYRPSVGLDISDRSIKIIELDWKDGTISPKAFADANLPQGIIRGDEIQDEAKLIEVVKRMFSHPSFGRFSSREVTVSLPEPKCFVRIIPLPHMEEKELGTAVQFEAEQYVPLPLSDVYLDWQRAEGSFAEAQKMYVLITAVPKAYVDHLLRLLDRAHLDVVALEVESQATARSLVQGGSADQAVLILDIATSRTSIIIVDSGVLEFTASFPLGGSALTEAIARNLSIPEEEAETLKRRVGITENTAYQKVASAMTPVLQNLLEEIRNAMRFQEEHSLSRRKVNRILLSGGGARLLGLAHFLTPFFPKDVAIELGDPFRTLAKSDAQKELLPLSREQSLGFATAIGLALRREETRNVAS